jgi:putative ABC transport system permease protein
MQDAAPQHGASPARHRVTDAIPLILTLASRNLFHDRMRFVATIIGIVFSIVLVTVQLGLYVSCVRMITAMIDRAQADLWIVPTNARSFEDTATLDGQERFRALATPGVSAAIPLIASFVTWRKPDGSTTPIIIVGIDVDEPGLRPWNLVEGSLDDLTTPNGVIVDRSYLVRLGVTSIGQRAEIRNQTARVVALTYLIRSFTTTPFIFTTLERARKFLALSPSDSTYYLVHVSPGFDRESVRARLSSNVGDAEVITPQEFHDRTLSRWLYGTGAGAALIGGAILGVVVGTVIAHDFGRFRTVSTRARG